MAISKRGKLVWTIDTRDLGLESTTWPVFKRWAQKNLRKYAHENYGIPPNWVRVDEGSFNLILELPSACLTTWGWNPAERPIAEWKGDIAQYCGELIQTWCLNRDLGALH